MTAAEEMIFQGGIDMMVETDRRVVRNAPLRDGTPRHEKGYRPYVETLGPEPHPEITCAIQGRLMKRIHIGPLFKAEYDAETWMPDGAVGFHIGPVTWCE